MNWGKIAGDVAKGVGKAITGSISSQAERYSKDSRFNDEARDNFSNISNAFGNMSRGDFSYINNDDDDDD